ncbi:MAG: SDR family NAD(P)-dependent oxidoreductase [Phycisphaerae bacterium]|nr:SDR family NAD(P)-dependent oxidoreductase [Phycisphaerae bacterium]
MMALSGRIAIVTGAGGGLGREHARFLAAHGAAVVVNDVGASLDGVSAGESAAARTVAEIIAIGGQAVASTHDVSDWRAAADLIRLAIDAFGALHVLVNNAGIIRDRTFVNTSEAAWDDVIRVNLKGHAAPTHHALNYWRDCAKQGAPVKASIVHTSSMSGIIGNFGQANYGAAKMGVVALSRIVSLEGRKYGIRSNVIAPDARTRLSLAVPESLQPPALRGPGETSGFDYFDPANVSPVVGWLAMAECPADSQIFYVAGNVVRVLGIPAVSARVETAGRWTMDALQKVLPPKLVTPLTLEDFVEY